LHQAVFFEANGAVAIIGLCLKPNHHNQVTLAYISDTHGINDVTVAQISDAHGNIKQSGS